MKKLLLICVLSGFAFTAQAGERHHKRIAVHFHKHHQQVAQVHSRRVAASSHKGLSNVSFQSASGPKLLSSIALIYDENSQRPLYTKNPDAVAPIASITKLMTAMVVLDAKPDMDEEISVDVADLDSLKGTHSRLSIGTTFTRSEMLKLALMSSENRAAAALARNYPGGTRAAVAAMNAKARQLGMTETIFRDPTGLTSENVSTARDLVKMVGAARNYALIHQYTTTATHSVEGMRGRELRYNNTNPLVKNASWDIGVSKTGFINEAGRCLVMQAKILERPVIIVLLDSVGKRTRIGDANRVKQWIEAANPMESRRF
ncbi:MAG: D-alanyl-D-alanine endopeptidase [Gallionellales bacterium CG03_land_8_20_14_0_80_55_15]|nr:D-alanyl-D-alanine endopeptidase [Gallionella sp.]PIV14805.1 MAG: D-alanyl-D-alanine endopeptidase [Gallionellales bacterium CG03_land_8_20_14_0_80_55_15]